MKPRLQKAVIKKTRAGKFYAIVYAKNGEPDWRTTEDFERKASAKAALKRISRAQFVVTDATKKGKAANGK